MRVVLDTNILVSALLWRGAPYPCLLAVQAGLAELIARGLIHLAKQSGRKRRKTA